MEFQQELVKLTSMPNDFRRRLYFCAILSKALEPKSIQLIVVGGCALEFYTLGNYATFDIDIICPEREQIGTTLESWGFIKLGRYWNNDDLEIAIEIPDSKLAGSYDRLSAVEIEGLTVYLIGLEDLIIDRLNAYVHWKSADDKLWVEEMLITHFEKIDWEYLEEVATREMTFEALRVLKEGKT